MARMFIIMYQDEHGDLIHVVYIWKFIIISSSIICVLLHDSLLLVINWYIVRCGHVSNQWVLWFIRKVANTFHVIGTLICNFEPLHKNKIGRAIEEFVNFMVALDVINNSLGNKYLCLDRM